ncbi:homoserine O-succinyltransferase [Sphingomonas sp. NSE70-1]|uniref:Homoserine O-succinyltransferase n=1 Tax=Sphingomonas caseinilyticus TaxID=2908205 RepID=A0ABT0RT95_9SPHN|nr:homoserine O-succinyltransferase [Sphingomonas caseinilyticus]MCL6698151.1 homoserine O-succinyltransferase [Sphingomonas caseinilyticus]
MIIADRCRDAADASTAELSALAPCGRARRGDFDLTLPLTHGGTATVRLRYEIVGPENAPVLLAAGGISAGRHVIASSGFPEAGWWQSQAGSFRLPDFRLLSIDWIGADGLVDRPIDPADQAEAIARLLDYRGIDSIAGFIGASYGAMVGMHFAARYPERCCALLAISAAASAHPFASACRALQRQALTLGEAHGDPKSGVALARALAILTYRTRQEFAERFAEAPSVQGDRLRVPAEDYLDFQGARHCERMCAVAYRRLSESIDLHRIDPAGIGVPLTLVAVDQDGLVPGEDIRSLADQVAGSSFHLIHSRYGHDAFLKEDAEVGAIIATFLNSLELSK